MPGVVFPATSLIVRSTNSQNVSAENWPAGMGQRAVCPHGSMKTRKCAVICPRGTRSGSGKVRRLKASESSVGKSIGRPAHIGRCAGP